MPRLQKLGRRARWGVMLEGASYALLWQSHFWTYQPEPWRLAVSILFYAFAISLSWSAARALGRHLRIDAGLDSDHQLVESGPCSIVRHPIYTSMLCLLLARES